MILSKGQIVAAGLKSVEVEVPEWGGSIFLRDLSIRDRVEMLDAITLNERAVEDYKHDQALPEGEREGLAPVVALDHAVVHLIYSIRDPETGERTFDLSDHNQFRDLSYNTINMIYSRLLNLHVPVTDLKKSLRSTRRGASSSR